ncbi:MULTISPECIES: hypothetical protein [Bacillus]|nr:hypothetical protein [Bacillus mojavensis]MEC1755728.1 hypothetical protein [Bacillus mojavensis]
MKIKKGIVKQQNVKDLVCGLGGSGKKKLFGGERNSKYLKCKIRTDLQWMACKECNYFENLSAKQKKVDL